MRKKLLPLMSGFCVIASALPAFAEAVEKAAPEDKRPLLDPDMNSFIWVLILFVILVFILYKSAWKHVLTGLKSREDRIRKDIADAEEARVKAEATLRDYTSRLSAAEAQVREILNKGAADAEKVATNIKMAAQKDAEEAKQRATQEIESAKRQALTQIYAETANLATSVAEKIIRRNLNVDDQRDLVAQSLEQLQTVSSN